MNFGELICQQPENIKKLLRKIENLGRNWPMQELPFYSIKPV